MAGFGIDVSVASAEEVGNAIQNQNITQQDAENYRMTFGKYEGKTIKEVNEENPKYIDWLMDNTKDEIILKVIELVLDRKPLSPEEQKEMLGKMLELQNLLNETETNRETFYKYYKVKSDAEMTLEQLNDAIEKLQKKL